MSPPRAGSAILTVFRKEFRENLRERRTLYSALVFGPLFVSALLAVMLGLAIRHSATESDATVTVAVAHGERAPNLVSRLVQYGVAVVPVSLDEAGARAAVEQGRFKQVLLVPDKYATAMAAGSPAPLELYIDSSDGADRQAVARLSAIVEEYNAALVRARLLVRGVDPLLLSAVALQSIDVATPADRSVLMLGTLSYFIIIAMLVGGQYLAIDATAGERERGSLEPLLTVPVRREQLLYGKILAACAFMIISLALTIVALSIVLRFVGLARLGMSLNLGPVTVLLVIACCVPLAPLGAALMTVVAASTRTYREAQTYVALALVVPTLPLIFASALGLRPTGWLMAVPFLGQHFLIMSLLRAQPLLTSFLVISVGSTLALGVAIAYLVGRLYRRESLLA